MHVLIFTGGQVTNSRLVQEAITSADKILAADGGANTALELKIVPEVVVGDMDSIAAEIQQNLQKKNTQFVFSPVEKDETDTELAIAYAVKKGATKITLLGGTLGDRIDHILANILYVGIYNIPIVFVNGLQKSFVAKGPTTVQLKGEKNDLLSLIPIGGDISGVDTTGLQWELRDGLLVFGKPRGVSNVFLQKKVTLHFASGMLFVVHTLQH